MRSPTAMVTVGGFGLAVAVTSLVITALVVFLAPEPGRLQITPRAALEAVQSRKPGFDRHTGGVPVGVRAPLIEAVVASELHRPTNAVRVIWLGSRPDPRGPDIGSLTPPTPNLSGPAPSPIFVKRSVGRFDIVDPASASPQLRGLLLDQLQPAFVLGVAQADGRWLKVSPREPFWNGWRSKVVAALGIVVALIAPIAWLGARWLTEPFRALARAIQDSSHTLPSKGPLELIEAAQAIDDMRTRLFNEASERARMFSAMAHDLRTPLTGLRLRVEKVAEPQRRRMVADIDRMQSMIQDVQGFSHPGLSTRKPTAVRALLNELVAAMPAAEKIVLAPGPDAWIDASPQALRRAIENLVRNAIDYAGNGRIETALTEGRVAIAVIDDGPGIPIGDRERLLQPFERGEASRNRNTGGTGLGLSIVADLVHQNGGRFDLAEAPTGGLVARLSFPRVDMTRSGS